MKKLTTSSLILVLGLMLSVSVATAEGPVHWGYEGEHGPEHWGELSSDYAACSEGRAQSPIDIPATASVNPADVVFNYQPTALNIVNNGHSIKVNYDEGSAIEVDGITYNLLQFHFHALSEHTINSQYYDMEMHSSPERRWGLCRCRCHDETRQWEPGIHAGVGPHARRGRGARDDQRRDR